MNNRYLIIFFVIVLAGLSSCKDNDNVFKTVLYANVNVINASSNTLNFYLNGTRQNNTSSLAPGSSSGYLSVPSGSENYQFKKDGTFNTLFNVPLTLTDSTNTSLYITGETTDMTFYSADFTKADLKADTVSNKFFARFVNAAPDAGNLTAFVGDTVHFSNRTFKSTSSLSYVTSGAEHVRIYFEGNTTAQIDTSVTFLANHIYTVYTKGLKNGTGSTRFSVGIIVNN